MDRLERVLLMVLALTTLLGLYWGLTDPPYFTERYMMEDGEIEYGTVVLLLASCGLAISRLLKQGKKEPRRFVVVQVLIVVAFFFVAGEEISWGQRIFNLESSEYFKENNAQAELNLHNLTVGEVKINKLIFGLLLTTTIIVYLTVLPLLYYKSTKVKALIDKWFIPVPRLRHSVSYLLLILAIIIIGASKRWELLEFGSVLIFFQILWNPANINLFRSEPA